MECNLKQDGVVTDNFEPEEHVPTGSASLLPVMALTLWSSIKRSSLCQLVPGGNPIIFRNTGKVGDTPPNVSRSYSQFRSSLQKCTFNL